MEPKEVMRKFREGKPKIKEHGQYQMSLGSLIKALQKERTELPIILSSVYQGYTDMYPGLPHSYYGYPSDLAFIPTKTPITVSQFLAVCETALKASFMGPDHASDYYRDYIMQANTPVWISEIDRASKTGIVDVVPTSNYIRLVTETIEDDEEEEDGSE
jgi:hypothetical protein